MAHPGIVAFSFPLAVGLVSASAVALAQTNVESRGTMANPLLAPSSLPFQAPPFDRIKDDDFAPAFESGIQQRRAEVDRIANNSVAPTFDNTLVALERSGQTLTRVQLVFN